MCRAGIYFDDMEDWEIEDMARNIEKYVDGFRKHS